MAENKNCSEGKRKRSSPSAASSSTTTTPIAQNEVVDEDSLTLSLSPYPRNPTPTTIVPPPPPPQDAVVVRRRRNPTTTPPAGKPATIPPPFPWSTNLRANVRSLGILRSQGMRCINGQVQCKRCTGTFTVELDLEVKFREVTNFMKENVEMMNQRAPKSWMSPALTDCRLCNQRNSVRPLMSEKKKGINWLFLFLGQTVGCCTLDQLKYFCKHNKIHRTGAKDRLVFSTYLGLYKQLQPNGP